jgi:hypothetical protein
MLHDLPQKSARFTNGNGDATNLPARLQALSLLEHKAQRRERLPLCAEDRRFLFSFLRAVCSKNTLGFGHK